ncbi:hypothetical protein PR048_006087, partial [Dryococelus australis]
MELVVHDSHLHLRFPSMFNTVDVNLHSSVPGSIPGRATPEFSHLGIVPDNAFGRRVSWGISRFHSPYIPALLRFNISFDPHRLSIPYCYEPIYICATITFSSDNTGHTPYRTEEFSLLAGRLQECDELGIRKGQPASDTPLINTWLHTRPRGATVAERLARSPPTKTNRAQSPPGLPGFRNYSQLSAESVRRAPVPSSPRQTVPGGGESANRHCIRCNPRGGRPEPGNLSAACGKAKETVVGRHTSWLAQPDQDNFYVFTSLPTSKGIQSCDAKLSGSFETEACEKPYSCDWTARTQLGIVPDNAGFLGDFPSPLPCIPALLQSHLISPLSALYWRREAMGTSLESDRLLNVPSYCWVVRPICWCVWLELGAHATVPPLYSELLCAPVGPSHHLMDVVGTPAFRDDIKLRVPIGEHHQLITTPPEAVTSLTQIHLLSLPYTIMLMASQGLLKTVHLLSEAVAFFGIFHPLFNAPLLGKNNCRLRCVALALRIGLAKHTRTWARGMTVGCKRPKRLVANKIQADLLQNWQKPAFVKETEYTVGTGASQRLTGEVRASVANNGAMGKLGDVEYTWKMLPDDAAARRVLSGISRFPRTCIPLLLRSHLISPSSALKSSMTCNHAIKARIVLVGRQDLAAAETERGSCEIRYPAAQERVLFTAALDNSGPSFATKDVLSPDILGPDTRCQGGVSLARRDNAPQLLAPVIGAGTHVSSNSASAENAGRCRWSVGFLGDLPFPPPLHSSAVPFSPRLTLICSQDFVVKSSLNLCPLPL